MLKKYSLNNFDLLYELVKTSFKLKYNGSMLGFFWVLLKPFLQFSILYIVFSNFSRNQEIDGFAIYLLIGVVNFSFIQDGVVSGVNSILGKANIVLKVNFNKELTVYSNIILAIINLIINYLIVIIFSTFNEVHITFYSFLYVILIMLVQTTVLTALAFFTSILTVRFRDLQHIAEVSMQLLFYGSAIFYPIEIVPEKFREILELNPIYIFIQATRNAVLEGEVTLYAKLIAVFLASLIMLLIGRLYFNSQIKRVAEYI